MIRQTEAPSMHGWGCHEYTNRVECLNCDDVYDADDHAGLLHEMGEDANGDMQYVCDECIGVFRCVECEETTLDVIYDETGDPVCPKCKAELDGAEVA